MSEVAFVFSCRTIQHPNGPILPSEEDSQYSQASRAEVAGHLNIEVEMGLLIEAFVPAQDGGNTVRKPPFNWWGGPVRIRSP